MKSRKHLLDLLTRIGFVESFMAGGRETLINDLKTQEAVIRTYEVIGEIVKRLPDEMLAQYPEINWQDIKGFRDFLIHNYDRIDIAYVWKAVEDLPNLKAAVSALLDQTGE